MKDPAFLFYSQDFLIGTAELTNEEIGQFIKILAYMHQKGRLDEKTIRLLVGSVSDNLRLKFGIDENGKWFNNRLELEIEKRKKFTESRRINGSKGGRPKKGEKPLGYPTGKLPEDEDENKDKRELTLKQKMKLIWMKEFPDYDFKQNDWADIAAIRNNIIDHLKNKQGDKYFNVAEAAVEAEFARIVQNFPEWYRQNALFLSSMADKNKFKMILNKIQPPKETIVAHDPRNKRQ